MTNLTVAHLTGRQTDIFTGSDQSGTRIFAPHFVQERRVGRGYSVVFARRSDAVAVKYCKNNATHELGVFSREVTARNTHVFAALRDAFGIKILEKWDYILARGDQALC